MADGASLALTTAKGDVRLITDKPTTTSATFGGDKPVVAVFNAIHYDTFGGEDHVRDVPEVKVVAGGSLWGSAIRP